MGLSMDLVEDDFVRPPRYSTKIKIPDLDGDVFGKSGTSWMDTMTTDNFITYRNTPSADRRHLEGKNKNRALDSPEKKKNVGEVEEDSDDVEGMMHTAKEVEGLKMNKMFMMAGDTFAEDVGIHKIGEAAQEVVPETVTETVTVLEEVVEEVKPSKKRKKKKEAVDVAEPEGEQPKHAKKEKKEKKTKA